MTTAASRDNASRRSSRRGTQRSRSIGSGFLPSASLFPALAFLVVLLFGGGAGTGYPLIEVVAQWLALALIVQAFSSKASTGSSALHYFLFLFAAAMLLLLAQIVPLPASWWHALPMRETAVQIDAVLGRVDAWHAFSLTPDATLTTVLALLVPLAAMLTVAALPLRRRIMLLQIIVGAAMIGTLLAALQVAGGTAGAPILYDTAHRGFGVGFFVNRNHQATLLLVAIILAAVPGVMGTGAPRRVATFAVIAFLALGLLATSSRTGLLLLPVSLIVALSLAVGVRRSGRPLLGAAALYLLGGALLSQTQLAERVFARFATVSEELRYQYWENSVYAVRETFPFGTGFGSFERIYRAIEPLGQVSPLSVNHVHNDFVELALEGGLPAVLLAVLALGTVLQALVRGWRMADDRQERGTVVAAGSSIAIILLFSLVDYPLRMAAIAGLFGAMLGLIAAIGKPQALTDAGGSPNLLLAGIAVVVGLVAGGDAAARFLVRHDQPVAATTLAPWSADAWVARANGAQLAKQPREAQASALRALAIVPVDAPAVRALGYADLALGAPGRGTALMQAGAALGWRDTLLQLWLVQRALEAGGTGVAAERIDALLRRGQLADVMMRQLRLVYLSPGGPEAIVTRLGDRPQWRRGFLNAIASDGAESLPATLAFLGRLRKAEIPATPDETMLLRWRLADRGDVRGARSVWLASGGRGELADGGFEVLPPSLPTGAIPYAWATTGLAGVRVIPADRGAGDSAHALQIVSDGLTSGPALTQVLALPPGRWRISAMVRGADIPGALTLACGGTAVPNSASSIPLDGNATAEGWRGIAGIVPVGPDCSVQLLSLTVRERAGQTGTFWIDAIEIKRVP
jgi:O-antigen ligase